MAEQGEQNEHEIATPSQVKARIRRILSKQEPQEENFLNIYPMIDMMTILLVFLIMQFANSTSSKVTESAELQIPYTISREAVDNALTVTVSRREILAPDAKQVQEALVTLNSSGQVDANDKQGGNTGFLIVPLLKRMELHRDRLKKIAQAHPDQPFTGTVQIIADKGTPFRTLADVIYTLGQCEFKHIRFVLKEKTKAAKSGI
ncbi:MAG: biopolymer transporter ExbD [Polyangiales bacterium]|nr:biopolymer transporter ExbD [Myxococcales bacterium]